MMRSIQEIFNAVIDEGFYTQKAIYNESSIYMCWALRFACDGNRITAAERHLAVEAIDTYLGDYAFLRAALSNSNLPNNYEDRLAIYRNWANRPQLTGTNHE